MQPKSSTKPKLNKRTLVATFLIIIVIPLILFSCGSLMQTMKFKLNLFGHPIVLRLHYAVSLLIIAFTMIPFFMIFEKRKPKARELIIIASLSAIAIAGRGAFFMLPQVKPVCAIVIITGVCFGAESGFLVGAITGFVSNFFFGQGVHTPWQMFCFGIIGFIAGLLFKKGFLRSNKLSLCIYGSISVFVIYGGIINFGMILSSGVPITKSLVIGKYISAIPMDLIHSISTAVFLFFLADPMIEKLERIKTKYGMIE